MNIYSLFEMDRLCEAPMGGFLYILSNAAMPGYYKVGLTQDCPFRRADQLFTSGVPREFEVAYVGWSERVRSAELVAHDVLSLMGFQRTPSREFFVVEEHEFTEFLRLVAHQCDEDVYGALTKREQA